MGFAYQLIMKKAEDGGDHPHVYKIMESGGKFVVYNVATGDTKGEHGSYEEALAHLKALYMNVPGAKEDAKAWANKKEKA